VHKASALLFLTVAAPLTALLFWLPVAASGEIFAVLAVSFPVALVVVGACRDGRLGPLAWPLVALTLILEGSVATMLWWRGRVADGPWVAGLPISAAVMIYGLFLAPLLLVGLAYALTFSRFTLREEDLEALGMGRDTGPDVPGSVPDGRGGA